jgi:N-methylhydantoinase B
VAADVVNGYVSIEKAREDYGVAMDPATLKVDIEETDKVRGSRKEKQVEG